MSVNIPLQLNGTPIYDLGSEFVKTQELDRDRGLIDPTMRDNVDFNNFYTTEYISGVAYQDLLSQNNYNPSEELEMTDPQARSLIVNDASLDRPLTVEEKEISLYTDPSLDPRLDREVVKESQLNGENLDFSQSQDFVREIQESVKSYNDEKNLYISLVPFTTVQGLRAGLIDNQFDFDLEYPTSSTFDILSGTYDILNKQRTDKQKARLRTVERPLAPEGEPRRGQKTQDFPIKQEIKENINRTFNLSKQEIKEL
jgi:hypothetical protein